MAAALDSEVRKVLFLIICGRTKKISISNNGVASDKVSILVIVENLVKKDPVVQAMASNFSATVLTMKEGGRNIDVDDDSDLPYGSDVYVEFVLHKSSEKNDRDSGEVDTSEQVLEVLIPPISIPLSVDESAMLNESIASQSAIEVQNSDHNNINTSLEYFAPETTSTPQAKAKWPYSLPTRFRGDVEQSLNKPNITREARSDAVRSVAQQMYLVNEYPTTSDVSKMARLMNETYVGFRTHFGDYEQFLARKIQQRQRKLRLGKNNNENAIDSDTPPKKRGRVATNKNLTPGSHSKTTKTVAAEDLAFYKEHVKIMIEECTCLRPKTLVLLALQKKTFSLRRQGIESGDLVDVISECPMLNTSSSLIEELSLIFNSKISDTMDRNWNHFAPLIIKLAETEPKPSKAISKILRTMPVDKSKLTDDITSSLALQLLPLVLLDQRRQKKDDETVPPGVYVYEHHEETSETSFETFASQVKGRNNPFIIKRGDMVCVASEQKPFVIIQSGKLSESIQVMMSIYYSFNISYPVQIKSTLTYIRSEIMEQKDSCTEKLMCIMDLAQSLKNIAA